MAEMSAPRVPKDGCPETLSDLLRPHFLDFDTVMKEYPFEYIIKTLLGAVPNVCSVLPLFPGAFHIHALCVPAMINSPAVFLGFGTDLATVGAAMYASSRTAGCKYCTLHCCTLLNRRGVTRNIFSGQDLTPSQAAATALGNALGSVPCKMTADIVKELHANFEDDDVEWHVMGASIMGWLNTVMDMLGTDMEESLLEEGASSLAGTGWDTGKHAIGNSFDQSQVEEGNSDGFFARLGILRYVPSFIVFNMRRTWGLPSDPEAIRQYLTSALGGSFSVLKSIRFAQVRIAIVMALKDNLTSEECVYSRKLKYAAGFAFASVAKNDILQEEMKELYSHESKNAQLEQDYLEVVLEVARKTNESSNSDANWAESAMKALSLGGRLSSMEARGLCLCLAGCSAPSRVGEDVVRVASQDVPPSGIMDLVSWMGILVMFNRMMAYYLIANYNSSQN